MDLNLETNKTDNESGDEFELKFEVYPPILSSNWRISNNGNAIPMYRLNDNNQNNFFIIVTFNQVNIFTPCS